MLYLNEPEQVEYNINVNLTLTSVVFESDDGVKSTAGKQNLTLTSVVFEFVCAATVVLTAGVFNFNKCCIWIRVLRE